MRKRQRINRKNKFEGRKKRKKNEDKKERGIK
jgi:hypothetical protein